MYGEEYAEMMGELPDPTLVPARLLDDWGAVLETLGVWAAERAALVLCIKIDKLKTMEKYERHYLLLGVVYTEFSRVRRPLRRKKVFFFLIQKSMFP